jgi:hypothetical protein
MRRQREEVDDPSLVDEWRQRPVAQLLGRSAGRPKADGVPLAFLGALDAQDRAAQATQGFRLGFLVSPDSS